MKRNDLELTDTQLIALGHFATQWSFFETEMIFTLGCLSYHHEQDGKVLDRFSDKMKMWKRLTKAVFKKDEIVAKYEEIRQGAKVAHDIRSLLMHGRVTGNRKNQVIKTVEHRFIKDDKEELGYYWRVQPYNFPVRAVRKWANVIKRMRKDLIRLNRKYLPAEPKALP